MYTHINIVYLNTRANTLAHTHTGDRRVPDAFPKP